MSDLGLGKIITSPQQRDAIHVAVAPVVAAMDLDPGWHIGIDSEGLASISATKMGIVDPFLQQGVRPGERFWMFLYPNTITALRHDWTHPGFKSDRELSAETMEMLSGCEEAENWIRAFSAKYGVSYDEMVSAAQDYLDTGEYFCRGGTFEGEWVPDEFWDHFEKVTRKAVPSEKRDSFFTCAC